MSRLLSLLTALALFISLTGCSGSEENPAAQSPTSTTTVNKSSPSATTGQTEPNQTESSGETNAVTTPSSTAAADAKPTTGKTPTDKPTKTKKPTAAKPTVKPTTEDEEPTQPETITKVYSFDCTFPEVKTKVAVYQDPKNGNRLPYRLYFPKNYDPDKKYPLLLALHGAGEIGTDNQSQLNNFKNLFACNGDLLAQGFVLLPQSNAWWNLDYSEDGDEGGTLGSALHLLEEIQKNYSIYKKRIYVTGLSMGGYATWDLLQEYGHLFAAGMPVCGGGNPSKAATLKDMPIKIYHSLDDDTVPFSASQNMYNAITAVGGKKVEFIQLDGIGHAAWDYAYADRDALSWLYSQEIMENSNAVYTYQPYLRICDAKGRTVLTEEDIETLYYTISYEGDDLQYTMELLLTVGAREKLNKAYAAKGTFTAYWLDQKMFTYTAKGKTINHSFIMANVFNEQNAFTFQDVLTTVCSMRRRLVWKNDCFKRR